jgi:hypothetical protein
MRESELKDSIIQKVLNTNNTQLLNYLNFLLCDRQERGAYQLSELESGSPHGYPTEQISPGE